MAAPAEKQKHLYFDRQRPAEEPKEPAKAKVRQEMFARRPPTTEDEYFFEQERKLLHQNELAEDEKREGHSERAVEPAIQEPIDRPDSIWQRVFRAVSRRFNTNWRP